MKNTIPPWWCSLPVRKAGSTRVPSIESVTIRSAFFAIERGTVAAITAALHHGERRLTCERTMLAINNITLERILLHSRATSMLTPGIERTNPWCETGTPINKNISRAATALSACKNSTTLLSANEGIGTIQRRNTSGNRHSREKRPPKQITKLAIHHSTTASMLSDNRPSSDRPTAHHLAQPAVKTAANSKSTLARKFARMAGFLDLHSRTIRLALIGSISSRWV